VDGNVTSFAYDGFGRKRRESRGVNPDVILNWDGDQMIVESSDLDPEAPSKAYYVADGVIYAENANLGSEKSRRDYVVDFLGSVTGLTTGSDASLSSVRRWSAYGKLLSGSAEPIGYFWTGNTGSRVYQSLGLNDNRARHYGRNIKQWITRDPLWPSELPYAYVGGNPVTLIDPSGNGAAAGAIALPFLGGGGAAGGAGTAGAVSGPVGWVIIGVVVVIGAVCYMYANPMGQTITICPSPSTANPCSEDRPQSLTELLDELYGPAVRPTPQLPQANPCRLSHYACNARLSFGEWVHGDKCAECELECKRNGKWPTSKKCSYWAPGWPRNL